MKTINSLRAATLLALAASSASADVSVVNGTLTISDAVGGLNSKIIVGPDPGMVSLYQVPGAADGETYMGIRALRVLSGAGPDQIDLEIEQASSFDVLVDTGAGESAIQVKWIVPPTLERVVPRLDLRPGAGAKRVFFDFDSFAPNVDLNWSVAAGAGSAEIIGEIEFKEGSVDATATLAMGLSSAADKVDLLVDSMAQNLRLDVIGRGTDLINTKVIADRPSNLVDVGYDIQGDARSNLIGFDLISAARNVVVDHAIRGGAAADEVKLGMTQIVRAPVRSTLQVGLGQSNDKLEILYGGVASSLTVSGGVSLDGGNDELVFISDYPTAAALNLHGNDGFDIMKAEIKGPLSGWRSGVMQILGGIGNDELILGVRRGGIESIIDGGPGFDIGFGPGRIVNCEIIN